MKDKGINKGMNEFIDLSDENYDIQVEEWYEEGQLKKCCIFISQIV